MLHEAWTAGRGAEPLPDDFDFIEDAVWQGPGLQDLAFWSSRLQRRSNILLHGETDGPKYADDFSLFCWGSGCPLQDRMGYEYTTKEYGGDGDVVHFPMSTGGPQGSVATILNE